LISGDPNPFRIHLDGIASTNPSITRLIRRGAYFSQASEFSLMGQSPSVPEVADSATEDVRLCEGLLNSLNKRDYLISREFGSNQRWMLDLNSRVVKLIERHRIFLRHPDVRKILPMNLDQDQPFLL
jgi:hypothetical protein